MTATCADSDRYFNVVSVELTKEQLEAFDNITKEYIANSGTAPEFCEQYPDGRSQEWKSKKEFNAAVDAYMKRYMDWMEEHRDEIKACIDRERELLDERYRLFLSFFPENGGVK